MEVNLWRISNQIELQKKIVMIINKSSECKHHIIQHLRFKQVPNIVRRLADADNLPCRIGRNHNCYEDEEELKKIYCNPDMIEIK